MVTTYESTDASPILVLPYELNVPGMDVITAFGGILSLYSTVTVVVNI
jgi:hypothetical protein